jgi:hypothetical protein
MKHVPTLYSVLYNTSATRLGAGMGAMTCRQRNFNTADVDVLAFLESVRQRVTARHMLHLGERSSDLNMLPMASCRQCQTWVPGFGGLLAALSIGLPAIACR